MSRKIHPEPMKVNSMEEKKEKRFCSLFITGSDDKIQDRLWLNELKNDLRNEKIEEEALQSTSPMEENVRIIIHERQKTQLSKQEKYILILIDTLICTTMIAPLVVAFWRGTWSLMDFHEDINISFDARIHSPRRNVFLIQSGFICIVPTLRIIANIRKKKFPSWLCFVFGMMIHTMFAFLKHQLYDHVNEKKRKNLLNHILCQLLRIAYTYVFGVICAMHWRGGWILLDKYFNMSVLWLNASLTTLFLGALIMLRCMRNLLAPPFLVAIDNYSRLFLFPSLCKQVSNVQPKMMNVPRLRQKVTSQGEKIVVIEA